MGRKTKHQKRYENVGQPTIMTPEVLHRLDEVFALDGTDAEACLFANISPSTLYNYQVANPEYLEHKRQLKETPFLKARRTIVNALDKPQNAFQYMTAKKADEFAPKTKVEHSGNVAISNEPLTESVLKALKVYEEIRDKQIKEEADEMV